MVILSSLELEGRTFVHGRRVVFAPRHDPEGPGGLEVHGVDGPGLAGDVPVAGPSVGQEDVTELLSALAHHHHPLVVVGPGEVLDGAGDGLELVLEDVLLVDGVPDPDLAGLISGGDIESTGTVLGHIDLEISVSQPASCELRLD